MINDICIQICTAALEDVIGAIEWDIEEVINVSFDDMHNVFNSEKLRRFTKGYYIKQPNMDCQPTEITALMRHRAVFS